MKSLRFKDVRRSAFDGTIFTELTGRPMMLADSSYQDFLWMCIPRPSAITSHTT